MRGLKVKANHMGKAAVPALLVLALATGFILHKYAFADDDFAARTVQLADPPMNAAAVTPHDTNELSKVTRCIYVGSDGDIALTTAAGNAVTFAGAKAGTQISVRAKIIKSTGTTATGIIAQW